MAPPSSAAAFRRGLALAGALALTTLTALPLQAQRTRRPAQPSQPAAAPVLDSALFQGLRYRHVGPFRGGRVTTVTGVPGERNTFYFGSTGGGCAAPAAGAR